MQIPLLRLQCGANSYDWGKKGNDSVVARFAAATPAQNFSIQDDKPYAELWMGTHPSNPSADLATGRNLSDIVADNPALLGHAVGARYHNKLPFLFKVLSIDKALSIQAHPHKQLAEELHARDPKNYPDDNHKPEMAIAITPFEGLCGFRPLAEIVHFLSTVEPLRGLIGDDQVVTFVDAVKGHEEADGDAVAAKKAALRKLFAELMTSPAAALETAVATLLADATSQGSDFAGSGVAATSGAVLAELVTRLHRQFGADVGLFNLFFLNLVRLEPGEAMFLMADDIHAYISGDIVECMAASDNVVRAGFTPKFKDVPTLVDMLTYRYAPADDQSMDPVDYPYARLNLAAYTGGGTAMLYDPPIEEFAVVRTLLRGAGAKARFDGIAGPSIVLCVQGRGKISVGPAAVEEMREGYVYFVGATAELALEAEGEDEFLTFKAFCELEDHSNGA